MRTGLYILVPFFCISKFWYLAKFEIWKQIMSHSNFGISNMVKFVLGILFKWYYPEYAPCIICQYLILIWRKCNRRDKYELKQEWPQIINRCFMVRWSIWFTLWTIWLQIYFWLFIVLYKSPMDRTRTDGGNPVIWAGTDRCLYVTSLGKMGSDTKAMDENIWWIIC